MLHETMKLITAQGERTIKVEITENDSERARGLMFRTQLADMPACCSSTIGRRTSRCG